MAPGLTISQTNWHVHDKDKVKQIYGLIDTEEDAMEQYELVYSHDSDVPRFIIENSQENARYNVEHPHGETACHYVVVEYIRFK